MYLYLIYISNSFAIDLRLKGTCQVFQVRLMVDAEGRSEGMKITFNYLN